MANSQIRWTRSDAMKLSHAVREFNKNIKKLEKEENNLILPEIINYQEVKQRIFTRNSLNQTLNTLHRFNKENEQRAVKTEMGELITNWELKELKKEKRRAEKRLLTELIEEKEINAGKRAGFRTKKEKVLEENLKSLSNLNTTKGASFKSIRERLHRIGIPDYSMYKASIYRQNFMEELRNLTSIHHEFKEVYKYFDSIKNPIKFYEITQKSDALKDFFEWYQEPENYAQFSSLDELVEDILQNYK